MADSISITQPGSWWGRVAHTVSGWFVGGGASAGTRAESRLGQVSAAGVVGDVVLTDERAMRVAAVWACVRIISESISALPLGVYTRDAAGRVVSVKPTHQLYHLLKISPNALMAPVDFMGAVVFLLCFYGNAYAYKKRNGQGAVVALQLLDARRMDVLLDGEQMVYRYHRDGQYTDFTADEVVHFRGFSRDGLVGLSPIAHSSNAVGVAVAMEDHARDFYANGAKTPKILTTGEQLLTDDQRAQVKKNFSEIASGPARERLWVLEAGFDTKDIGVSPADAQMLEQRKLQVGEIARIFGVPPHLIGDVERSTSWGSGIEQQNIGFLQHTLRPYIVRIEQTIRKSLIAPQERASVWVEFKLDGLLRADTATRGAFLTQMVTNGIYTINEARKYENKPPVEGGDVPMVPLNMARLTDAQAAAQKEVQRG